MKYMAIIDADEKPVSCEFIGCNGNVAPYLIGATTNIKALEQGPILDKIRAEINELPSYVAKFNGGDFAIHIDKEKVFEVIDKYKADIRGEEA